MINLFGGDGQFSNEDETDITMTTTANELAVEQFARNFRPDVVILEPKRLRRSLKSILQKTLECYSEEDLKMYQFFYPNGTETGKDEFIRFYSQVYYYLNRNLRLEHRIDCILKNDDLTRKDLIDILRWKVGATAFDYTSEVVANQWRSIDVGKIMDQFGFDRAETRFPKEKFWKGSPKDTMCFLKEVDDIGPVYAITLLYFLSKGTYPIYDKFAHIAIKTICGDKGFGQLIDKKDLNEEIHLNSAKTEIIFNEYQEKYVERIQSVFQDQYKTNRDIDRALWVYGHLFNNTKSNANRLEE